MRALTAIAFAAATMMAAPVAASDHAGSYLAARTAMAHNDFEAASGYYARLLVHDSGNAPLMEDAVMAYVAQGDFDRALAIARRLVSVEADNQLGNTLLIAELALAGDYAAIIDHVDAGPAAGALVDDLSRAWALVGVGRMGQALEKFRAVADTDGLQGFGNLHLAMALAMAGDFETASTLFFEQRQHGLPIRGLLAHGQVLALLGETDVALQLLDENMNRDNAEAVLDLRRRIEAGAVDRFDVITTPAEGIAEVFFSVAAVLVEDSPDAFTLLYARTAEYLRPDHTGAILLAGGILDRLGQFDLANRAYDRIDRNDPAFLAAELGRADALRRAEQPGTAIEVLTQLSESHGQHADVWIALGDILRAELRYDEASKAYDRAIEQMDTANPANWFVFYVRGISHERVKRWPEAEADFRKALELNPDQPQVLNYIGYSFVEMNENLDEALQMIERAVELRPDNGYITDSLGWVLYRLNRYHEAVEVMEKAAALMPLDPIVNDHLGDTFWAVGRKREARFQWNRAMSLEPEDEDAKRIRRKLEVGLDKVLEEEGAAPLAIANDG